MKRLSIAVIAVVALLVSGCQSADQTPIAKSTHTSEEAPLASVTITSMSLAPSAGKFTATSGDEAGRSANGTTWRVRTPRVDGGDAKVRDAFNGEFTRHLNALVAASDGPKFTLDDGTLTPPEQTRAVVGLSTLSGVMITTSFTDGAAHPNTEVTTVVMDSTTGDILTLDEVLADPTSGRTELLALAVNRDSTHRIADAHTEPRALGQWIALPDGLHLYVPVIHAMGDFVPVTIPWAEVSSLLKPSARQLLVG